MWQELQNNLSRCSSICHNVSALAPCPIPSLKSRVSAISEAKRIERFKKKSHRNVSASAPEQHISPTVCKFSSCAQFYKRIINMYMYYAHILYHTIQTSWPHISGFSKRVRISHSCFRNVHPKPIKYGLCTQDWITCCHILPSYAP